MQSNRTWQPDDLCSDQWNEDDADDARNLPGPIWVVGASGFIGSKLFFSLAARRNDVYAVSKRVDASWRLLHAGCGETIACDITQRAELAAAVQKIRPRTVFNLAAYGAYERQNLRTQIHAVNYLGVFNLIQSLRETGCDAFVQAGTSSEYGLNCAGPKELDPLQPNSDYAVAKVGASYLLGYYGGIEGFPCVNLRLYSIYGPWEERDRLIPRLISLGLQGTSPPFANPDISRDFVYIDDCTRAFVRAALTACRSAPGRSFNIATGTRTTLRDVANLSAELFQLENKPVFGSMPNRRWDLSDWFGDPTRAREELGWQSRISLETGLSLTADWERHAADRIRFAVTPRKQERLSAVIACYRDAEAIPIMHERLTAVFKTLGTDYEIIFVNDHSPADDERVIERLCREDSHVLGITHSRNFGSQSAFISGMEVCTGDAAILLDGDLQDPPAVIAEFYQRWKEGYDIVYGVRTKREASWYMQIFYKFFYRIFRYLSEVAIPVDAGDFSLIDRKAMEYLLGLSERDLFLRGLRAWIGFRQIGVPYVRPERMFGKSTNNLLRNIWWAKKGIFSFSLKPLYFIQAFGICVFAASMALAVFYLIYYFTHPPTPVRGITTIILLVLGLSGVQIFFISILGDYLGKILEETKQRPRFIRARILQGFESLDSQEEISELVASRLERLVRRCYGERR